VSRPRFKRGTSQLQIGLAKVLPSRRMTVVVHGYVTYLYEVEFLNVSFPSSLLLQKFFRLQFPPVNLPHIISVFSVIPLRSGIYQ